jgi:hypothetical protein
MKPPDQITVRCCACTGTVTFQAPRSDPEDRPTFFHTIPACKRFDETNTVEGVVQYLRDCGDARERN